MRQYLEQRGEDDIGSLWIAQTGAEKREIKVQALYSRVLKCSEILSEIRGKQCNIFPHSIRHSRAECLVRGEDDRLKDAEGNNRVYSLDEVRILLNHDDISTTQIYLKDRSEEIIDDMFGFNKDSGQSEKEAKI